VIEAGWSNTVIAITSQRKYSLLPMKLWLVPALFVNADDIDVILGPLIVGGIIATLLWYGIRRLRLRTAPARWVVTEATIQSDMPSSPAKPGTAAAFHGALGAAVASHYWRPVLQYSYQVQGEFYSGYFMLNSSHTSREEASAAARPWLQKKIFVRYNPKKHHESAFLVADGTPAGCRSLSDQPPASEDVITLSLK